VKIIADLMYENVIHDQWKVLRNLTKIVDCINFPVWDLTGCSYYAPYTIMVDPTGEIYKCQRLMDEEYCTGDIYNGINSGVLLFLPLVLLFVFSRELDPPH
jgi:sulfatase maturation enzyme AslB (radical SAM superfamily)